jgi:predicted ferric reductase
VGPHFYWYLSRASGIVAFWLLTLSAGLGMSITSRLWDGLISRAWVYEIHKFLSLLTLGFIGLHIVSLIPDPWIKFGVADLLIPGVSPYRALPVAIGVIAMYGTIVATGSSYVKRWIGHKTWRTLHYTTFATFVLALLHGLFTGTDSTGAWMQFSYLGAALSTFFLGVVRILSAPVAKPASASAR